MPLDPLPVLLVEDSDDDLFFLKRLLAKAGVNVPLAIATDGQMAITHLELAAANGEQERPPIPQLIFLDLKLPLRGGIEVLQWIRTQASFAESVVVILSSSAETRDVTQAFACGAQGYLVKYPDPAVFAAIIRRVAERPPGAPLHSLNLPGLKRP